MKCLVDLDMLVYEVAFGAEYKNDLGEKRYRSWEWVEESLHQKIREIEEECFSDEPSELFLTTSETLHKIRAKHAKSTGLPDIAPFEPNFRFEVAKSKVYKGTRKQEKPANYKNVLAYMVSHLNPTVYEGMEADDALCITAMKAERAGEEVVICSRDKDLRICPTNHYQWGMGKSPSWGPEKVSKGGWIEMSKSYIKGGGMLFFYSQLLTGDGVDNIGGLAGVGPKGAYNALKDCKSNKQAHKVVVDMYKKKMGDDWQEYLVEQSKLLWMVQDLDSEGQVVHYDILKGA